VAYLLINGELPTAEEFETWRYEITHHTFIHENVRKKFLEGFHHDAHPMGILVATVAALSTFYPEAKDIFDDEVRRKQIVRLIAKMPTLAAGAFRFSRGMPFVYPDNSLDFSANFLSMLFKTAEPRYDANPVLAKALDVLFILHADHEQNCSHHRHAHRRLGPRRPVRGHSPQRPPRCTGPVTAAPTKPC
jgi:citrate synthase